MTTAGKTGAAGCLLITSWVHWSSNVTRRCARILWRPRCKVRTWVSDNRPGERRCSSWKMETPVRSRLVVSHAVI